MPQLRSLRVEQTTRGNKVLVYSRDAAGKPMLVKHVTYAREDFLKALDSGELEQLVLPFVPTRQP